VDGAFFAENLLRTRNVEIVHIPMPEVSESGTVFGSGQCGHPRAAAAAMQIQAQPRMPLTQRGDRWRQDIVHIGIVFKESAEAVFHHYGEPQIGPRTPQNVERGSGQNAVAQGPEPDHGDAATVR
jgi:hypothetical protein